MYWVAGYCSGVLVYSAAVDRSGLPAAVAEVRARCLELVVE